MVLSLPVAAFVFTYFISCSLRKTIAVFLVVPLAVFLVLYFVLGDFLVKGVAGKYFTGEHFTAK